MVENGKKLRQNSHPIICCPTSERCERSERSGGRERSEQSGASERVTGASERANGRASDPVVQSVFLAVIDHSEVVSQEGRNELKEGKKKFGHQHIIVEMINWIRC